MEPRLTPDKMDYWRNVFAAARGPQNIESTLRALVEEIGTKPASLAYREKIWNALESLLGVWDIWDQAIKLNAILKLDESREMAETEASKKALLALFNTACESLHNEMISTAAAMGVRARWHVDGSLAIRIPNGPLTQTLRKALERTAFPPDVEKREASDIYVTKLPFDFGLGDSMHVALQDVFSWKDKAAEDLLKEMEDHLVTKSPANWPGSLREEASPQWSQLDAAIMVAIFFCDLPAFKRAIRAYERFIRRAYNKWRASGLDKQQDRRS
jgi:hypothetical protein